MRFLLDTGATIEANNEGGCTSLFWASHEGHTEVIKLLIARGAIVDACDNDGVTPLHRASQAGRALAVHELLAHGANPNARRSDGWAPLHVAAMSGHADALRELLRRPETDVNARTDYGSTPLLEACRWGGREAATLLIAYEGINLNLLDNAGCSVLFHAKEGLWEAGQFESDAEAGQFESDAEEAKALVVLLELHGATEAFPPLL